MPMTAERWTKTAAATAASINSRAYLRHLDKCGEILGARLNTIHNLYYFQELMRWIREAIENNSYAKFSENFYQRYQSEN